MKDLDALVLYPPVLGSNLSTLAPNSALTVVCERRLSQTRVTPALAQNQICSNARAWEEPDGSTVYLFQRPLFSGNPSSVESGAHTIEPGFTRVSWAVGQSTQFFQHSARSMGVKEVNFFTGSSREPAQPKQLKLFVWLAALIIACALTALVTRTRIADTSFGQSLMHRRIGPASLMQSSKW
jgi:hypothetical protein